MPRGQHGGARQGAPGAAYANRTDLMTNSAPQTGTATAASGGMGPDLAARSTPSLTPDQTPFPTDPTAYPGGDAAPVPFSPTQPEDEATSLIRSLALVNPNPDLRRLLARLENR